MARTLGAARQRDEWPGSRRFGDLTLAVALESPVSHEALCRALDRLAGDPPERCPVVEDADLTVHFVSVDAWHRRATDRDVLPNEELAARAVHRRLADSLGAPALPERTDPFVTD